MKKVIALILALLMVAAMFAGCDKKVSEENENVTIKWIMPGPGKQVDSDKVWTAFNEKLQEYMPGVNVEIESFPWNEYAQKVLLMQTSGEQLDIINTAPLNFGTEVRKGSFLDITELVENNCKELKEEYVDYIWKYMSVNGKIYAVPSNQGLSSTKGVYVPKDLSDKYWDIKEAEKVFTESSTMTEECYDVVESYLKNAKNAGEIRSGFQESAQFAFKGYENISDVFAVKLDDKDCKVVYLYETDETKKFFEKMSDWYKKGYIRKDVLSSYSDTTLVGNKNGYILWTASAHKDAATTASKSYGMDIDVANFYEPYIGYSNAGAGGNAISASSKNAETAVKFLNLLNTNEELFRLLAYGIEGDHYEKISENKVKTEYSGNATSRDRYGLWTFALGNTFMGYEQESDPEGYFDYLKSAAETLKTRSNLIGFIADTSSVTSEYAQVMSLKKEYTPALISGVHDNWEEKYDEFISKIKLAGLDKIKAELQKQVDEYIKNNK